MLSCDVGGPAVSHPLNSRRNSVTTRTLLCTCPRGNWAGRDQEGDSGRGK